MTLVRVYSDASLRMDGELGPTGGWGAVIIRENVELWKTAYGPFKDHPLEITTAEAMAAVNGLFSGLRIGMILPGDEVLFLTDNRAVPRVLRGEFKHRIGKKKGAPRQPCPVVGSVVEQLSAITEEHEIEWRWNYCRGHQQGDDMNAKANRMADRMANKGRAQMRKMLKGEPWMSPGQRHALERIRRGEYEDPLVNMS